MRCFHIGLCGGGAVRAGGGGELWGCELSCACKQFRKALPDSMCDLHMGACRAVAEE
jgi:hypothetical protein